MPRSCANPGLVALLRSWTTAAETANHSSQQASTLRKAAKSLAAHPTAITCKDEALQVKFIGEKIASALGDWLAFERAKQLSDVRTVARLRHTAEERWWSVRVCGSMAWRAWGKHANGIDFSAMDNWEHCHSDAEALAWAVGKATKQLTKGYEHCVGSEAMYEAAKAAMPSKPAPRTHARAGGAARATASGGAACSGSTAAAATQAAVPQATAPQRDSSAEPEPASLAERLAARLHGGGGDGGVGAGRVLAAGRSDAIDAVAGSGAPCGRGRGHRIGIGNQFDPSAEDDDDQQQQQPQPLQQPDGGVGGVEEAEDGEDDEAAAVREAADSEGQRKRVYHPKLLNGRGEVSAAAGLLVALHRAGATGRAGGA